MSEKTSVKQEEPVRMSPTILTPPTLTVVGDNGSTLGRPTRPSFVHTVSIVIEPVESEPPPDVMDTEEMIQKPSTPAEEDVVQNIMLSAQLRKEEFARLLEEHAQIVMEINKAENSLS